MKFTLLCLFTLISLSCFTQEQKEITGENYTGVVYSKYPYSKLTAFTPDEKLIQDFESNLQTNLKAFFDNDDDTILNSPKHKKLILNDLSKYNRRYFGEIDVNGNKILFVQLFHSDIFRDEAWKSPTWSVDGGGHYAWELKFDSGKKIFSDLWINAEM